MVMVVDTVDAGSGVGQNTVEAGCMPARCIEPTLSTTYGSSGAMRALNYKKVCWIKAAWWYRTPHAIMLLPQN